MRDLWDYADFEKTVKDFEFTRRAVSQMNKVVYSAQFEDMDSDAIFAYLFREMELISFKDYLKRYIYEHANIDAPFRMLSDDVYRDIIMDSFKENGAPHSFEPTTRKWGAIVRSWLMQDSVKRQNIFLLGFGLRMTDKDVSEFLTKVIREEDFHMEDPQEVIFRYCYAKMLPYAKARSLLEDYDRLSPKEMMSFGRKWRKAGSGQKNTVPQTEEELFVYLAKLKESNTHEERKNSAHEQFLLLIRRAKEIVADIYQQDEDQNSRKTWRAEDISSADLEKIICCGIPVTGSGNLRKMSDSVLSRHFRQKRFSRQRIESVEKQQLQVERFDLITLLFFIYSQEEIDLEPEVRCMDFIDEANKVLTDSGMMELHPVNPYEAFVLMCLLAEEPLGTYAEIWEMSYASEERQ